MRRRAKGHSDELTCFAFETPLKALRYFSSPLRPLKSSYHGIPVLVTILRDEPSFSVPLIQRPYTPQYHTLQFHECSNIFSVPLGCVVGELRLWIGEICSEEEGELNVDPIEQGASRSVASVSVQLTSLTGLWLQEEEERKMMKWIGLSRPRSNNFLNLVPFFVPLHIAHSQE